MNCYQHRENAAIGLCKTCFKAVCDQCSVDIGNGLACKNSCEETVAELNEMWERSAKIYGVGKYQSRIPSSGVLLWLLLSAGMWFAAGLVYFRKGEIEPGLIAMAVLFTAGLGIAYYSARRTGLKC